MIQRRNSLWAVLVILAMVSLVACSLGGKTPSSKFYVLSARPATSIVSGPPLSVLLGPLSLPDVVLRPQITTRPEPGRVIFSEYHRWAGDLGANVEEVVLQNLSERLGRSLVIPVDSSIHDTDYRVSIRFQRFDGMLGRDAVLEGAWRLKAGSSGCLVGIYRFSIKVPVSSRDYSTYVQGLDEGLARLSNRIALMLVKRPECPGKEKG